jgi:hypothetical protein
VSALARAVEQLRGSKERPTYVERLRRTGNQKIDNGAGFAQNRKRADSSGNEI